ncbi:MAG: butyrate kinase [Candidatus Marinimicrobia bacterium]|nr:butyrate kinase [Candidatus Neomarinimicrobiota bacterium]MCF7850890.1 butyrate kinase [Candidatus Neomarinimicrobiota bacterium]MCF7904157.1 butyrate kinase [Candidatus Neomarinimicrobiota bacterium]
MKNSGHILVINPGSTSTKLAIYTFDSGLRDLKLAATENLDHSADSVHQDGPITDQLPLRLKGVHAFLKGKSFDIQLIMARSGPLKPMIGGTYAVSNDMLEDLQSGKYSNHASNLGALLGKELSHEFSAPVYVSDPITTDEFDPVARISGVPEIERKSRAHALNIKACVRKVCLSNNIAFEKSRWVVGHLGGGISIAAVRSGKLVDVNDALLGMGPFSPERAGALPIAGLLELAFSGVYDQASLSTKLSRNSGLKAYLGTTDLQQIEEQITQGNKEAKLVYEAMVYQIAKEIGAMASVLSFNLNGIILTGGMANSTKLCAEIISRVKDLTNIYIEAGENELQALAEAGYRIACGEEPILQYESEEK